MLIRPTQRTPSFVVVRHAFFILLLWLMGTSPLKAMFNTFEVGVETLVSTSGGNPDVFTSITFAEEFTETPLVFLLPSTEGGQSCDVRIRNKTAMGFDAVCAEASGFNGPHVAVEVQYIAIVPGVTSVPTNPTSAGPIVFEAGSISTQTVQHNCAGGAAACGTTGWDLVNLSSTTTSDATIIAQIQGLENETANPPNTVSQPFLSATVDINQGSGTQFGLALERSEVDDSAITTDEEIGWLVVRDTGVNTCVTLDFSTLGGPASVPFQAIVTDALDVGAPGGDIHGGVDGWDDGCNSGSDEGALFANACFANTPVVLASKRTHNEADGGWLRQCTINTNEVTLTIDEDTDRDPERNHVDEGVSVLAFGASFNTPVTLNHLSIEQSNRNVTFEWQTSSETFNVGFNLWGKVGDQWQQLNQQLLPAKRHRKEQHKAYSKRIRLSRYQFQEITEFGLSSVDVSGKDEFFGPLRAGQKYGEQQIPEPIDWSHVKAQYVQKMIANGYQFTHGRWRQIRPNTAVSKDANMRIDVRVSESGMYRISYHDLLEKGIDWRGEKPKRIAVTHKGKPVARRITGVRNGITPDSAIEFYATAPQGSDALYVKENVYQLHLDRSLALAMPKLSGQLSNEMMLTHGLSSETIGENRIYSSLVSGDPWVDTELFSAGAPNEKSYLLNIDQHLHDPVVLKTQTGRLRAEFVGGFNLPGTEPDHHVQLFLNDVLVADLYSDGLERFYVDVDVPASVFTLGENELRVVLPGDTGYGFDLVSIDNASVYFPETLQWFSGQPLALQFLAPKTASGFQVTVDEGMQLRQMRAYIMQANGNVASIKPVRETSEPNAVFLPVPNHQPPLAGDWHYWLGSVEHMQVPQIEVVEESGIEITQETNYLIVANPAFMNQSLTDFAEQKTNQGLSTTIVNWLTIVEQYGYGMATPEALRHFLTAANEQADYDYVLLVGGHSYDYLDYLNQGVINFIPAWYDSVDIIQHAPTDTPFVDLDADGLPDKAIGRWPVRTEQDLAAIIQKTADWQSNGMNAARNSLLIAQASEANRDFDKLLTQALQPVTQQWPDSHAVFMDDLIQSHGDQAKTMAKQMIIEQINQGAALTVYNGHASSSAWALDSLFDSQDVAQLSNTGLPTLLLPMACYTTYYETPDVNTLAHQWLFSGEATESKGAVGIHGATVFSDYLENTRFAKKVLAQQLSHNKTLGQAILTVKRTLSPWHNMVNNWSLLGDPSLRLVP